MERRRPSGGLGGRQTLPRASGRLPIRLSELVERADRRALVAIILLSCLIKTIYAGRYYGFFSGDDVEIHEMVLAAVFEWDWQAWDIRCAFYPMVFLFPVVALAEKLGVTSSGVLVFLGRLVVIGFSAVSIWLTFLIASRLFRSVPVGVIAACFLALNKLHTSFATTVLPRTVAGTFVLLVVWLVVNRSRSHRTSLLAGVALGVAAAIRFTEAVFILPALVHWVLDRRFRDAWIFAGGFVGSFASIVGLSDALYWGQPFSSALSLFRYTFLDRATTRGYQPFYHYVTTVASWSSWPTVILAVASIKLAPTRIGIWALAPLLVLSFFPHKEARYLVPVVPFVVMMAAGSFHRLVHAVRYSNRPSLAQALLTALLAGIILPEVVGLRFRSSEGGVDAARYVAARPDASGVLVERWTSGGRIYLWRVPYFERLTLEEMADHSRVKSRAAQPQVRFIIIESHELERFGYTDMFEKLGFRAIPFPTVDPSGEFTLFAR